MSGTLLTPEVLWWVTGGSLLTLLLVLLAVPWVVARLPADYFVAERRRRADESERAWHHPLLNILRNLLGAVLALLGLLMLLTPGQGLLTLLAGLLLMNFPCKYRLERWLVQRPGVFSGLNWLRGKVGKAAFEPPH
jgi:small-conductance mechanosensitive channel